MISKLRKVISRNDAEKMVNELNNNLKLSGLYVSLGTAIKDSNSCVHGSREHQSFLKAISFIESSIDILESLTDSDIV